MKLYFCDYCQSLSIYFFIPALGKLTAMTSLFNEKVERIKSKFSLHSSPEERYNALIEMGRRLPPYPAIHKTPEKKVRGCQSDLYLHSSFKDGKIFFEAFSDALISAGLAALLIAAYSGLSPEEVLKSPPHFLTEIGINGTLSLNRSNGLAHIHLRMKQEALACFSAQSL